MARRRSAVRQVPGEVPVELTDPDHPLWSGDPAGVEALAAELGINYQEPRPSLMRDPYFERFKVFRRGWAEANGFADSRHFLDLSRLREAGVYASSRGPRYRLLPSGEVAPVARTGGGR